MMAGTSEILYNTVHLKSVAVAGARTCRAVTFTIQGQMHQILQLNSFFKKSWRQMGPQLTRGATTALNIDNKLSKMII
jgi:hypothetical protein